MSRLHVPKKALYFASESRDIEYTYPMTDNGSSMITFAFTLTGKMFSCTLVLKKKKEFKDVQNTRCSWTSQQHLRLQQQVDVDLGGVEGHAHSAQNDVECSLIKRIKTKIKNILNFVAWQQSSRMYMRQPWSLSWRDSPAHSLPESRSDWPCR